MSIIAFLANPAFWAGAAKVATAAGPGIASLSGGMGGDSGNDISTRDSLINYTPEAEQAQKSWWDTLSNWSTSGNYGATDMNWDDIFKSAKKKINQYYWGGVGDTGLAGKVKASAARRNASQSPALENSLSMMGMEESSDIGNLITNLITKKAAYTENARKTWLQSLMGLAGLKSGESVSVSTPESDSGLSKILGSSISSTMTTLGNIFK